MRHLKRAPGVRENSLRAWQKRRSKRTADGHSRLTGRYEPARPK